MKIKTTKRELSTTRNVLDNERAATKAWLIALGVPAEVAANHDFSQRLEVKTCAAGTLVKSTYFYNCFACAVQTTGKRSFIQDGKVIADVENNYHRGYSTFGHGKMDTKDGEDGWLRDEGMRDFDRVAHKILRGE